MINRYLYALLILFFFSISCTKNQNEIAQEPNETANGMDHSFTLIDNEDEKKIEVWIHGEHFTSYLYSDNFKKPILYPIKTSDGKLVSRGFPLAPRAGESQDHPHQAGLWLNYGDVDGLDFWNHSDAISEDMKESYGTIIHKEIVNIYSGDDKGELEVEMEWVNSEGDVLLFENTIFVFRAAESSENGGKRIIDRTTTLTAAGRDISLSDNKEGMLGLRVTRELEHPDEHEEATGIYRSSEGLEGNDVWGTRARWVSLSGLIEESPVSITIFDHPGNVGFPTYWHARGYGLFAANPLGMKDLSGGKEELNFSLSEGESVAFKYRIMISSGAEVLDEEPEEDWKKWTAE